VSVIPDPQVPGGWLVRLDGADQSWVDPGNPERLEFDYMVRIAQHIDAQFPGTGRLRVIHIGGGGMSLARYIAATRPTSAQIVLEPNAALTDHVRQVLPLPKRSGIKVRPVDGRSGIEELPPDYADVVILDAFADGQVPAELVTTEFFAAVLPVLHDDGLFVANLIDETPFDWTKRTVSGLMQTWPQTVLSTEPAVLKGRRLGNLVAAASLVPLPLDRLTRLAAGAAFPYKMLSDSKLTSWIGGASPFTDADTRSSPPRNTSRTWFGD
jgi:spermidine synthase